MKCLSQKVIVHVFIDNKLSKPGSDTIYYDFNRKLIWADFRGKPDSSYFGSAITASGFAFNASMHFEDQDMVFTIGVYPFFTKSHSWKKNNINSDYLLLHEQHHFDITRLGAQKFVEEIKNAHFTADNYNTLLNSIYTKVYYENQALQQDYDLETKNSVDIKKQEEWNNKIAGEIKNIRESYAP
ncbi:MAG: hypothetical protein Q8891_06820 [Bacteroidota bacterium]|nr:hypothetical protein [Bacteroidota bacterium]